MMAQIEIPVLGGGGREVEEVTDSFMGKLGSLRGDIISISLVCYYDDPKKNFTAESFSAWR